MRGLWQIGNRPANALRVIGCLFACILLSAAVARSNHQQTRSAFASLGPQIKKKEIVVHSLPTETLPKIDHGYIAFSRRIILAPNHSDAVHLQSLDTGTVRVVSFWFRDVSVIWVNDLAVQNRNQFFVVGSALRSVGGASMNFMAHADAQGHTMAVVDMGTYEPELACVGPNGTTWTFGQDWTAERSDIPYFMLRNYSSSGRLVASYLSSDSLPPVKLNFSMRLHGMGGAPGRIFLQCGSRSVGTYIGPDHIWAEVDLDNGRFESWGIPLPGEGHMTGLALVAKHTVYCSFRGWHAIFLRGFFKLDLDQPKIASWEPVSGMMQYVTADKKSAPAQIVAGADGPNLVYLQFDPRPMFIWVIP